MRISDWSSDVCSSDLDPEAKPEIDQDETSENEGEDESQPGEDGEDKDDSGGAQDQQVDARPELSDGEGEEDDQGEAEGESDGETDADLGEDGAAGMLPVRPNRPFSDLRSEEHTSELQSLISSSYAGVCLK